MALSQRDAKRQAARWILGLVRNFDDAWVTELHALSALDAARYESAMEELLQLLQRAARPSERQRQALAQRRTSGVR